MSTWKRVALVNGGGIIGIIVSLFIVSPRTPLWLWATLSAGALLVLNYVCFVRRKVRDERKGESNTTAIVILGFVVLLLDLVLRYLHH